MSKPAKIFRCGPDALAIWSENKTVNGAVVELHSIKLDKSYKEGDQWKRTQSFAVEDLPKIAMLAQEAYKYLRLRTSSGQDNLSEES